VVCRLKSDACISDADAPAKRRRERKRTPPPSRLSRLYKAWTLKRGDRRRASLIKERKDPFSNLCFFCKRPLPAIVAPFAPPSVYSRLRKRAQSLLFPNTRSRGILNSAAFLLGEIAENFIHRADQAPYGLLDCAGSLLRREKIFSPRPRRDVFD